MKTEVIEAFDFFENFKWWILYMKMVAHIMKD